MTRRLFRFHTTRCFVSHLSCKPLQLLVRGVAKKSLAQKYGIGWGRQRIRQGYSKLPYIFTVRRVGEPREKRGFHGDKVDKCGNADWNRALKTSDQSSVSKGCIFAYSHNPIFFFNLALLSCTTALLHAKVINKSLDLTTPRIHLWPFGGQYHSWLLLFPFLPYNLNTHLRKTTLFHFSV